MNEIEPYSNIIDIKEADSKLEIYRKDIIEKYIEYEIPMLYEFREENKSLDDYIDYIKTILWYIKNQRAEQIKKELGI